MKKYEIYNKIVIILFDRLKLFIVFLTKINTSIMNINLFKVFDKLIVVSTRQQTSFVDKKIVLRKFINFSIQFSTIMHASNILQKFFILLISNQKFVVVIFKKSFIKIFSSTQLFAITSKLSIISQIDVLIQRSNKMKKK